MAEHGFDDEQLRAAIALSLSEQQHSGESAAQTSQASSAGLAGLDRKAMEAARLARMAKKRQRSISPPPVRDARKAPKLVERGAIDLPNAARLNMISTAIQRDQESRKPAAAQAATNRMKVRPDTSDGGARPTVVSADTSNSLLQYPRGVVKKTWAFGHDRTSNDIKIEEVLEPLSVRTAVLSAYQWDVQWVLSKLRTPLNGGTTKCIFVMQAKKHEDRERWREDASDMRHFLRLCFPSMAGLINCMHSKLMLLFHAHKLRIAIPTANLLNFDWGETGQMENSVFLIDLPRLSQGQQSSKDQHTFFMKELLFFLEKQGMDQDVLDGILKFDFSATSDIAFVHTVGGAHLKDQASRTGLLGLSRAINEFGLSTTSDLELDFAASSIGLLTDKQLENFHAAARGVNFVAADREACAQAGSALFKKKGKGEKVAPSTKVRDKIRIYFPTKDTVQQSTAGAAGTICLQRSYYEKPSFPRDCFRDYKSTRPGLLSHNKILCAHGPPAKDSDSPRNAKDAKPISEVAWVYVGSANMSQSAWGQLPADRTSNEIKCRNWECGVLLPVPTTTSTGMREVKQKTRDANGDSETESEAEDQPAPGRAPLAPFEVVKPVLDLPFRVPGELYGDREPWYFTESH